jgi:indole-3-glycerol phosphate synthase
MSNALTAILEYKAKEVRRIKTLGSQAHWLGLARQASAPRDFAARLRRGTPETPAFICEFKRKSPSGGQIRPGASPERVAQDYAQAGASCLSILTDEPSFGGTLADMQVARKACELPVLRKDFIIDPLQVLEARAYAADAILIILAAVDDTLAEELERTALDLEMAVLIEVHDEIELERANRMRSSLIGINNRNLKTLQTDLATTEKLAPLVRQNAIIVAESGVRTADDVKRLAAGGATAFLVGETLLRAPNVQEALKSIRQI